jgi:hypothetical protein
MESREKRMLTDVPPVSPDTLERPDGDEAASEKSTEATGKSGGGHEDTEAEDESEGGRRERAAGGKEEGQSEAWSLMKQGGKKGEERRKG